MNFVFIIFRNAIKELIYGLFFEKKWKVAITPNNLSFNGNESILSNDLNELPISTEYNFYADPFFLITINSLD